jgi:hypothetical protein
VILHALLAVRFIYFRYKDIVDAVYSEVVFPYMFINVYLIRNLLR